MNARHIPDPSRPTEWALEMSGGRITLWTNLNIPYGVWEREDSSEVLFNRNYVPIIQRDADGNNVRPCPPVWVDRRRQSYFWSNTKTGWPCRTLKQDAWARRHGEAVLCAFEAGEPIDLFVLDPSPLTKR